MDARANPRRSRGDRGRPAATRPKPTGCTARASPCSRSIIRARPRLLNAKARLAGYLARTGQLATAEAMFREIVHSQPDASNLPPSFAHVLRPYVDLLLKKGGDPAATAEIFAATQLMVRPGLAQTQAVLARELSGGTDEASRLFRQSVTLTRQVERARIELARLRGPAPSRRPRKRSARACFGRRSADSQKEQLATQAALGSFPRYRAVSSEVISLADLQKTLRPGEAYYRMTIVGDHVYAMLVTPDARARGQARRRRRSSSASRSTPCATPSRRSRTASARPIPFDVALSHQLYGELFGPFAAELAGGQAPDLRARRRDAAPAAQPAGHGPGVGRRLRQARRGRRRRRASISAASAGSAATATSRPPCQPALLRAAAQRAAVGRPQRISRPRREHAADGRRREAHDPGRRRPRLHPAAVVMGASDLREGAADRGRDPRRPSIRTASQIVTGDALHRHRARGAQPTSTNIGSSISRPTAWSPRARAKCAAQPALLTSFGGNGSDGLLTFREIFDLHLDADLVILSACDTAGKASAAATQQAGLATGGDVALDGLVRAFVGAGGRLVIASHWPVPDDYNATQRLITGLVLGAAGHSDGDRAAAVAAPADGRREHVAPVLLVGVRGGRRRRNSGDPRRSSRSRRRK